MAKGQAAAQETERQGILDESGEGFTFDMSTQEADSGFPVHPAGTYDFTVDQCDYQISQASGNPMWALRLLITGPGEEVAEKKVIVRNYQVFKPDQMGRVRAFLDRVAPELATPNFNPKQIADDGVLVGKTGRVRLKIRKSEEYGDQNEVAAFIAPGAATGGDGAGGFAM